MICNASFNMNFLFLGDALYFRTPLKLKRLRWLSPIFHFSRNENENVKAFLIPLVQAIPVGE